MKYFLPGPRNFTAPANLEGRTVELMRQSVLTLMEEKNVPKSLSLSVSTNFKDLTSVSELDEQFAEIKLQDELKYVALVLGFKLASHSLGFSSGELLADFSAFDEIAARKSDSSQDIADLYKIKELPAILLFEAKTLEERVTKFKVTFLKKKSIFEKFTIIFIKVLML